MTIKQDFKQLLIYTMLVILIIVGVGMYEPAWRTLCIVLSGLVVVMFTYTGKNFIEIERLAQDIVHSMQAIPKAQSEEEDEWDFDDDEWSNGDV